MLIDGTYMQTTTVAQLDLGTQPSGLRIFVITVGWLLSLFGAFSVFSISLTATFLTLAAGGVVITLASRRVCPVPPPSGRDYLVWQGGGTAVIIGVLWLIGEDRVRHWTPHPAGYLPAWYFCLSAFRHLQSIARHESAPANAGKPSATLERVIDAKQA
jgi:hypothetical protein